MKKTHFFMTKVKPWSETSSYLSEGSPAEKLEDLILVVEGGVEDLHHHQLAYVNNNNER